MRANCSLLVSYVRSLSVSQSNLAATFKHISPPSFFFSPPSFGIYEQRAHNVTTTFYVFLLACFPLPPFFPLVAELRLVAVNAT